MLERKWPDQTLEHYSDGLECREPSTHRISTSGQFRKRLLFARLGSDFWNPNWRKPNTPQGAQE